VPTPIHGGGFALVKGQHASHTQKYMENTMACMLTFVRVICCTEGETHPDVNFAFSATSLKHRLNARPLSANHDKISECQTWPCLVQGGKTTWLDQTKSQRRLCFATVATPSHPIHPGICW
jgi:hypothetical protein